MKCLVMLVIFVGLIIGGEKAFKGGKNEII